MLATFSASAPMLRAWPAKSIQLSSARWSTSRIRLLKRAPPQARCSRLMQPIAAVVEHGQDQLLAEHDRGLQLGVHHHVAAVADHDEDFAVGQGHLHAQAAGDLVAHAGEAVFHVVAVGRAGPPQLVQLARQAAGGADDDVAARRPRG